MINIGAPTKDLNIKISDGRKIIGLPSFLLLLFVVSNLVIVFLYVKPQLISYPDTEDYLSAMRYFQEGGAQNIEPLVMNRMLTSPLMLYFSIALGYLFGSSSAGMIAVNIIFYFLMAIAFYRLAQVIWRDDRIALFSSIFFIANFCIFNFGLVRLTDMGGWLFFVTASFLAVGYFLKKEKKFFWLAIAASSVGFLFKGYALLGLINLVFLILLSDFSLKIKIKEIVQASGLFLLIPAAYCLWFYFRYHFSYFDVYYFTLKTYGLSSAPRRIYTLPILIKVMGWLFFAGWPVWLYGFWQQIKSRDAVRQKILLAMLPASVAFLLWPGFDQRVDFVIVPWLALIAGFGLSKIKSRCLSAVLLIAYLLSNYNIDWLMRNINLPF